MIPGNHALVETGGNIFGELEEGFRQVGGGLVIIA